MTAVPTVAAAKSQHWLERKAAMTPMEILAHADELRRHAREIRPDWPSQADRADDLMNHARVAEALRAVSLQSS